jgi:DNA-binding transcriptional ArsR family regulator
MFKLISKRNDNMASKEEIHMEIMPIFKECLPIFSALNDEKRQEIILILLKFHEEGITVNAITERVKLSRPAVSHHLKILKQAGIVGVVNRGVENYYFLTLKDTVKNLKRLTNAIEENCTLK